MKKSGLEEIIPSKVTVVDGFLDAEYFKVLQDLIMGQNFPWYRNESLNYVGDGKRQFTHTFYRNGNKQSWAYDNLAPLLEAIKPFALFRIKANLLPSTPDIIESGYHRDVHQPCTTAILYLNTNNGYTKFKDGQKIESVENRFVTFPSFLWHTGTTSSDGTDRVVINFNYIQQVTCWEEGHE